MRAEKIAEQEKKFAKTLTNSSGVKYKVVETVKLKNYSIKKIRPNFATYYYIEKTEKTKIVLHFTVGTLRGDLATLTKKNSHVSVPYVIARDGSIYEVFNPDYWAYHLGRGTFEIFPGLLIISLISPIIFLTFIFNFLSYLKNNLKNEGNSNTPSLAGPLIWVYPFTVTFFPLSFIARDLMLFPLYRP